MLQNGCVRSFADRGLCIRSERCSNYHTTRYVSHPRGWMVQYCRENTWNNWGQEENNELHRILDENGYTLSKSSVLHQSSRCEGVDHNGHSSADSADIAWKHPSTSRLYGRNNVQLDLIYLTIAFFFFLLYIFHTVPSSFSTEDCCLLYIHSSVASWHNSLTAVNSLLFVQSAFQLYVDSFLR